MSTSATGTFEIDGWDEKPYDEREGTRLTRTRVTKTFHGDIEGESTAELLMAYGAMEGSAAYVGFERIVGSVNGRKGSFVLHHNASGASGLRPGLSFLTRGPASFVASRARSGSPSERTADTPSRSATTSSNEHFRTTDRGQ